MMVSNTISLTATHYFTINLPPYRPKTYPHVVVVEAVAVKPRKRKQPTSINFGCCNDVFRLKSCSNREFITCVGAGDGGDGSSIQSSTAQPDSGEKDRESSPFGDSYVPLFVRMLGMDYDPMDREQAIVALWKYSLGGNKCINAIMQFPTCINLIVNILKLETSAACEAAAGLLRSISSVNVYRDLVGECGAIEEINRLLSQSSLTAEVKEQSICTLWNLSVDEKFRVQIANSDILPLLVKSLDDQEGAQAKEAAAGVLANLSLSHSNHEIMVEAGVIPKLARVLQTDEEISKVLRKATKSVLLELSKDKYYRILLIEEGLVPVPLVGTDAYKSFKPSLYSWPSLPDGTEIKQQTSKLPSKFGASELLLGLNISEKDLKMEEDKKNAVLGLSKQQFLARFGAIELEDEQKSQSDVTNKHHITLLPWVDGVARLVLILGLEDEPAVARAAESIADACINEHMRVAFKEAGAIKLLVQLLEHSNNDIRLSALCALERLSVSNNVSRIIEAEGAINPLINTLKQPEISEIRMEKTLDILASILDPNKEMKPKFYDGPVNGTKKGTDAVSSLGNGNMSKVPIVEENKRNKVLDSAFISSLVEILKASSANLQRKAASVLEYVTVVDPSMDAITSVDIESGLNAVFEQRGLEDMDPDIEVQRPENYALQVEEAGHAISAVSRLLTKLLDSEKFCQTINTNHFTKLLRKILKSDIPLQNKEWVAAGLVKLSSLSGPNLDSGNPINMEVTLYETVPRLLEQIKSSYYPESREAAVVELSRIISEGIVDLTRAVASEQGIYPLVKLLEEGSERAVEASLVILYNLSIDSENHSTIIGAGAVPVLRRTVLLQRPHWTRALRLLRNLPV